MDVKELIGKLSDEDLGEVAREALEEFKRRSAESTVKIRCPACNTALKEWHQYKPSYTQVALLLDVMEMMQREGVSHVHIKSATKMVPLKHRGHCMTGPINNHYSKMMYLGMLTRCTETGDELPQFSFQQDEAQDKQDSVAGGAACFKPTKMGIAFVLGREPLKPAEVRVKNCQVIHSEGEVWVKDVYSKVAKHTAQREKEWLARSGQMVIHYPRALEEGEQSLLWDEDEED